MALATSIPVYPQFGTTSYPDAAGVPITAAGAIVDISKYILDAVRAGHLVSPDDPLGIYLPDDRTGTGGGAGTGLMPGWLNVRDFGARGDGVTDDTAQIQAAIDAASIAANGSTDIGVNLGTTLYFPPGVYIISHTADDYKILMKSNVKLVGVGESSVIQSALGQPISSRMFNTPAAERVVNITVQGMCFRGRESEQPDSTPEANVHRHAIFLYNCDDVRVVDCIFEDVADAVRAHGNNPGGLSCNRLYIARNIIRFCWHNIARECIQLEAAYDSVVEANYIHDCPWATALKMENGIGRRNSFVNNVCMNVGTGIAIQEQTGFSGGGYETLISGNTFQAVNEGCIQMQNVRGVRCVNNSVIQADGFAITVFGSCRDIIIQGNQVQGVTLAGGASFLITAQPRDGLRPADVLIQGNTVTGTGAGTEYGILVFEADNVRVANNTVRNTNHGVTVLTESYDVGNVSITDNTVEVRSSGIGFELEGRDIPPGPHSLSNVQVTGNIARRAAGAVSTTGTKFGPLVFGAIFCNNNMDQTDSPLTGDGGVTGLVNANNIT